MGLFVSACVAALGVCAAGCASDVPGLDPLPNQIRFPIGVRVLPGDKYLMVANSNFDLQFNSSTLTIVDTATNAVDPRHTTRLNTFAGDFAMRADGSRAYIASRSEGRLTAIDLDQSAVPIFKCTNTPAEPGKLPKCDGTYVTTVPGNPFGILLLEPNARAPVAGCGTSFEDRSGRETLLLTHLNTSTNAVQSTGVVSAFESVGGRLPLLVRTTFGDVASGLNAITPNPVTGTLWVTSRFDVSISLLRYAGGALSRVGTVIPSGVRQGIDHRGVAFKPDGSRAYVAYRATEQRFGLSTPILSVFDTRCEADGRERNAVINIVDMCQEPGQPYYFQSAGRPDLLFVPCGLSRQVYVLDPDLLTVERIIDVGDGAYYMDFTAGARTGTGLQRAYVSNFREDSISVLDLDPRSPNYLKEIARIRENSRILQ